MNKDCSLIEKIIFKEKLHKLKKVALGPRVQILRVLIQRYYQDKRDLYTNRDYLKNCEAVLDNMLCKFNYELEDIIDKWRTVAPALKTYPTTCEKCGYRPVFCSCN